MLDLENMVDLEMQPEDQDKSFSWKPLTTKCPKGVNANPGAISHHSSVNYDRCMYLFGGNQKNGEENS